MGAITPSNNKVSFIIPSNDKVSFIGKKGVPIQNIMVVCNFNMQFIYIVDGWKGSTHDTKIFLSALYEPTSNFPKPPQVYNLNIS